MSSPVIDPELHLQIPRSEKLKRLTKMTEDEFRDKVVRQLFFALGYRDGRELHGADEQGKDVLFEQKDPLGETRITCVQTKRGKINMSSNPSQNIGEIVTQLRMALKTRLARLQSRQYHYPDEVILCASGTINTKARNHIADQLEEDRRLRFLDAEALISLIDEKCPHLWQGISVDFFSYYDSIRKHVEQNESELDVITPSAASDRSFVDLTFYRETLKRVKYRGSYQDKSEFEELRVHELIGANPDLIVAVGNAGSGKSTALWRIAYEIARRDQGTGRQLPIIVNARDLKESGSDVTGFLGQVECLAREFASLREHLFRIDDVKSGRVTLLVDGLDEISNADIRKEVCEMLRSISAKYPKCAVITTTRPDPDTESYFRNYGVRVYEIAPISWRQVRKIVKQVLENRSFGGAQLESAANGAQQVLRQIEEVHGFQLTPLLATVCAVSAEYSTSDVPANVTELFNKYCEVMLGRWDEHKGLKQQIRAPLKDFLLQKVALSMHRAGTVYISRDEFSAMVERLLGERGHRLETQEIEDELLSRSRLLRTRGSEVGFAHLLLQEFFAGRAMPGEEIGNRLGDPWWTKAIVFFYGDNPEQAGHLRGVQEKVAASGEKSTVAQRTIGLSAQASYLSLVKDRLDIWRDLVGELAGFTSQGVSAMEEEGEYSLTDMTYVYLALRDAVPFNALRDDRVRDPILASLAGGSDDLDKPTLEAIRFWVVVSLLESGLTMEAYEVVQEWKFSELRYCFWISMGAFFQETIVPVSEEQRRIARRIRRYYEDKVTPVTREFLREHRSLLLEKRGDKIVEVPSDEDESDGTNKSGTG